MQCGSRFMISHWWYILITLTAGPPPTDNTLLWLLLAIGLVLMVALFFIICAISCCCCCSDGSTSQVAAYCYEHCAGNIDATGGASHKVTKETTQASRARRGNKSFALQISQRSGSTLHKDKESPSLQSRNGLYYIGKFTIIILMGDNFMNAKINSYNVACSTCHTLVMELSCIYHASLISITTMKFHRFLLAEAYHSHLQIWCTQSQVSKTN